MLRYFSTSSILQNISKSALAKLRKKTGYTFANCRKALELHNNDIAKAEEWLREQAQALGWAKATKLEGRPTSQGLIGVAVSPEKAVMVEVNCETDFVARNGKFKSLVETVAATCLKKPFETQNMVGDSLKTLTAEDGVSLADHVALAIGSLGENVCLRRAFCYTSSPGLRLAGCTHPVPEDPKSIQLGKYGALLAFRAPESEKTAHLGRQLCQHVIGMNPKAVGEAGVDDPAESADDETVMIHQEYLLDPSLTVGEVLDELKATVVTFRRFECGEEEEVESVEENVVRAEG